MAAAADALARAADWALGLLELRLGRPGPAFDRLITLADPSTARTLTPQEMQIARVRW